MTSYTDEQIEKLAKRRAKAKMGWLIHAFVYFCVNFGWLLLATLNDRPYRWVAALGWGLGLALHGFAVWFLQPGNTFSERMIEHERQKLKNRQ
jgi:hypothetical protein